jgi:CheY-like chemotaxis protein
MTEKTQSDQTGNALFEEFIEQIKQALDHLYDFPYLQQHALARIYDSKSDLSARTSGRQLRQELIAAIESFKPKAGATFRAPEARVYNMLYLIYIENISIHEAALELGLSERQAYRDLKRGQELIAGAMWNNRLSKTPPQAEFTPQSEIDRIKLTFSSVDLREAYHRAQNAVRRLAEQHSVPIESVTESDTTLAFSTDPALAHQILVSVLSFTIQHTAPGTLEVSYSASGGAVTLKLRGQSSNTIDVHNLDSVVLALIQRLHWAITIQATEPDRFEISLRMTSGNARILVIDDNQGWAALLERYVEGLDCIIVPYQPTSDPLRDLEVQGLSAIVLDVMMPEIDGWQILQMLRAQATTAQLPIIVCTVFNDPQLAFSLGASAFLPKPTTQEQFLSTLKEVGIL